MFFIVLLHFGMRVWASSGLIMDTAAIVVLFLYSVPIAFVFENKRV